MKVDLQTGEVFTDSGEFLKTLNCPLYKEFDEIKSWVKNIYCDSCKMIVHNTVDMTDLEIKKLLNKKPDACLMISLEQSNCTVLHGSMKKR